MKTKTISTTFKVNLVIAGQDHYPLQASAYWSDDDPFAVRMTFFVGDHTPEWIFARELLAEGLYSPSGSGDVIVWVEPEDDGVLHLALSAPLGEAHFELSRLDVVTFLHQTDLVVPPGAERMDVDDELDALLKIGR